MHDVQLLQTTIFLKRAHEMIFYGVYFNNHLTS